MFHVLLNRQAAHASTSDSSKADQRDSRLGSLHNESLIHAMILPIAVVALAELLLILSDLLIRLSVPSASVLSIIARTMINLAPVLVAAVFVMATTAKDQTWAVLTAAVSALTWLVSTSALINWFRPGHLLDASTFSWLTGIMAGLACRTLLKVSDRYSRTRIGAFLSRARIRFLSGVFISIAGGLLSGWVWVQCANGLEHLADYLTRNHTTGLILYGMLHRLLRPIGLHTVLDDVIWKQTGSFVTNDGSLVTGDLSRFLAGDATAGVFTAGFYPVMLFIIPVALAALYLIDRSNQKRVSIIVFIIAALSTISGGLSIAADYLILLISPVAYLITILMSGLAFFLSDQLQILHGFSLGPGVVDYLFHWAEATRPQYILITGGVLVIPTFLLTIFYFKIKQAYKKKR